MNWPIRLAFVISRPRGVAENGSARVRFLSNETKPVARRLEVARLEVVK
jgi:hypothetical protein